jgi:hypothetical protein
MLGTWLLVPEHLRLGTWDLLRAWTGRGRGDLGARLALQLVGEAALCTRSMRHGRTLSQKGFELANGLPFVASDGAIHDLLDSHTVAEAESLQTALGWVRRASGHYRGKLLALDPHRMRSFSKRQMRRRSQHDKTKPAKMAQTFFCLDVESGQPVCLSTATPARTVAQATPGLLKMAVAILGPQAEQALVMADTEHFSQSLMEDLISNSAFEMLVAAPNTARVRKRMESIPPEQFTARWAGIATAKVPYRFSRSDVGPLYLMVQRSGERPEEHTFKGFLSTKDSEEADAMTLNYPKRWHVEEFFNANQTLGWQRAGTLNLNIRYGQMTMALIAQAAIHQLRRRLGRPYCGWAAQHLARHVFQGLDGDLRVCDDHIVVTFYNAPNVETLRRHYEHLPSKLRSENVDPRIPWLYDFQLDFRFK